jgi:hypothetical protein
LARPIPTLVEALQRRIDVAEPLLDLAKVPDRGCHLVARIAHSLRVAVARPRPGMAPQNPDSH